MSYQQKLSRGFLLALLVLAVAGGGLVFWGAARATPLADQDQTPPHEPTFYDPPDPYDLREIAADPQYYERVVPSRVWQQAPLPPGKIRHEEIQLVSRGIQYVRERARLSEPLAVRAKPNRPVTFTALDSGHFANGQLSITVPADENGYAHVDFWVGDAGDFRVLAGSPENQGPAEIILQALTEQQLKDLKDGTYAERYWARFNRSPQAGRLQKRAKPAAAEKRSAASAVSSEPAQ